MCVHLCVSQAGDVLIVNCTDVGWSPYFPLVAGLVTEIGGLISHGAVVAREYGIPCVVNIPDATVIIQNGRTLTGVSFVTRMHTYICTCMHTHTHIHAHTHKHIILRREKAQMLCHF